MADILADIVEQTWSDVKKRKRKVHTSDFRSFEFYDDVRRNLAASLSAEDRVSVIAEVKKASPSKGIIRHDFDALKIATGYEKAGASAISVLTDNPFFKGRIDYLTRIRKNTGIPLLRKDFIVDPYQVEEARAFGADALLLIVRITEDNQLDELLQASKEAGLQCLVECYDANDFRRLDFEKIEIVGVNNRDLENFDVHIHQGISLLREAPVGIVRVSESGLHTKEDLNLLFKNGIHAALIGESLMREQDPGEALKKLINADDMSMLN